MKKQNNKITTFRQVLDEMDNILSEKGDSLQSTDIYRLKEIVGEGKKIYKIQMFSSIFEVVFVIFICVFFIITIFSNINLKNDVYAKATIITKLENENKILNIYIQGKVIDNDSIDVNDTVNINMLSKNSPALNIDTKQYFRYSDLKKEYERLYFENFSLKSHNKLNKYDQVYLKLVIDSCKFENKNLEIKIDLINKRYGISFVNNKIHASKVDSAMVLLPVFRDRLKYNSECKCWNIRK